MQRSTHAFVGDKSTFVSEEEPTEPVYPVASAGDSTPSLGRVDELVWYDEVL
jgi:hypothetical protein